MSQRTTAEHPMDDRAGELGVGLTGEPGGTARTAGRFRVRDVEDTLKLYAALALLLEAGLGTLVVLAPTETVQLIAVVGMLAVFALMVVIAGRNWEPSGRGDGDPGLQPLSRIADPLWGDEHTPLEPAQVTTLQGRWRCEWTARTASGDLKPYVDDTVTIREVNPETGELEATGSETYEKNPEGYKVRGRVSKQGLAHLYYRYPTALHQEKVGMAILRIDFINEVAEGWWLGGGRGLGRPDTGGLVRWTKADRFEGDWVDRAYEHDDA